LPKKINADQTNGCGDYSVLFTKCLDVFKLYRQNTETCCFSMLQKIKYTKPHIITLKSLLVTNYFVQYTP